MDTGTAGVQVLKEKLDYLILRMHYRLRQLPQLINGTSGSFLRHLVLFTGVVCVCLLGSSIGYASDTFDIQVSEDDLQKIADGTLTLMAFTVLPDITTSSLSITSDTGSDPSLRQATLGGGFTISDSYPLYLEGTVGYSRYDPTFVAICPSINFEHLSSCRLLPYSYSGFSRQVDMRGK